MKRFPSSGLVIGLVMGMIFTCNVFAQEKKPRVIEEELVLKDPTVSAAKKWAIGGSIEYWYVGGDYEVMENKVVVADGEIDGDMAGGNFFLGYGNWTLMGSIREGDWDVKLRRKDVPVDYTSQQDQEEKEIKLRYLMRAFSSRHFVPYIIFGYNEVSLKDTETITTPGWIWTRNGTTVQTNDYTFKSFLLGAGAVVPFNKYLGMRGDISAAFTDADVTYDTGKTYSGDGVGAVGFLTGYWNIVRGLNFQVGGKLLHLNGGDEVGWYTKTGWFGMLGYSYKF